VDPVEPPQLLRVCPRHGLVAGLDGRCVICHRNDVQTAGRGSGRTVLMVALACAALLGGTLVLKGMRGRQRAAPAETAVAVNVPPPPPPPDEDPAPRPAEEAAAAAHRVDEQNRIRDVDAAMYRIPIKMYVDGHCDMCEAARGWMKEKGLRWSEVDVAADPDALEALKKLTPSPTVPTFEVGGEVLVGFGPSSLLGAMRRAAEKQTR
jgi:glutaredoxin